MEFNCSHVFNSGFNYSHTNDQRDSNAAMHIRPLQCFSYKRASEIIVQTVVWVWHECSSEIAIYTRSKNTGKNKLREKEIHKPCNFLSLFSKLSCIHLTEGEYCKLNRKLFVQYLCCVLGVQTRQEYKTWVLSWFVHRVCTNQSLLVKMFWKR